MKFWEAMKALEEGKRVRCKKWDSRHFWENGNDHVMMARTKDTREEWELYEDSEQTFSFTEVVKGLKEGRVFKRKFWKGTYLQSDMIGIFRETEGGNSMNYFLEHQDFEATDWVEINHNLLP